MPQILERLSVVATKTEDSVLQKHIRSYRSMLLDVSKMQREVQEVRGAPLLGVPWA